MHRKKELLLEEERVVVDILVESGQEKVLLDIPSLESIFYKQIDEV